MYNGLFQVVEHLNDEDGEKKQTEKQLRFFNKIVP